MPIQFHSTYVQDLSVENPNAPASFFATEAPEINVQISTSAVRLNEQLFKCTLQCEVKATSKEGVAYLVSLTQDGVFILDSVSEEELKALAEVDGPTILFPYLRASVADAIRMSGFPVLHLGHIDFVQQAALQAAQQAA